MRFVFLFSWFALLVPFRGFSQYANDWVRPGQSYYRIPVAKNGIYKLTQADLQSAGVPASVDPRLIQLFHRGREQSIFVQGQADAVLNPDDYLEFFGQANDGTRDKILYKPSTSQPHNYYNLFSDTTAYFLTWSIGAVPGKRVVFFDESNVANIAKEVFHNEERLVINKNQYSGGFTQSDYLQFTHFDVGEGWTGNAISQGQSIDYTVDLITNKEIGSGNPQLELLLVGRDPISHSAQIFAGPDVGALRQIGSHNFAGYEAVKLSFALNWSDIGNDGKLVVRLSASSAVTNRPQFSTSYLKIVFPQNFQSNALTEKFFCTQPKPSGKLFVEWGSAPSSMRVWDVTDPSAIVSVGTRVSGINLTSMVPSAEAARRLYAFTATSTPSIRKVNFRLIDPAQADYLVVSNKLLMKPALAYSDPVKAYAGFRASAPGGSYDTLVVSVDQLYNQFNYGETSPAAIYEFMRFMVEKGQPKYLFLIGKARDVNSGFHRLTNPGSNVFKDLVPTAGMPGSDMNFTVGLSGTTYEPAVPTGRLSATTPMQVANYLNKIKEIETASTIQTWQKEGLHLSGGIRDFELPIFRSYLDGYKARAEGNYWGGEISTLAKRDPSPSELINISQKVNEGLNIVTFFGHSSPSLIDIDVGFVTNPVLGYSNQGKYPVFLINGCNAGEFFLNGVIFGEDWINAPNKGARNFIAHSSYGFVSSLRSYSDYFYKIGFADSVYIKKGIGDVQKEVARQYMLSAPQTISNITQVQQMVLLGDPAVRMFNYSDPDYEIKNSSLSLFSFEGKPITALTDSFAIKIIVSNLGVVKNKPLKIRVTRSFVDGTTSDYDSIFSAVLNLNTLLFKIRKAEKLATGNNSFLVKVDPENKINELNENNNEATLTTFLSSNATLNLFPNNFGIVDQPSVRLIWQSSNPLSLKRDFQFEVDTTLTFDSPFKIKKTVSGKVLAHTTVTLLNLDSTVYYWRTRFDKPATEESNAWSISSFSYIEDSPEGWAQLRKGQAQENSFSGIIFEGEGKPFRFDESKTYVEIKTFGSQNPLPASDASIKINGSEYNIGIQGFPCRNNTINLVAFNKTTAVPYTGIPTFYPRVCGREPQLINSFAATELETALDDDIEGYVNALGVSDSVVIFSIGDPVYATWPASVKLKLGELGVALSDLNALQSGDPIIIFGKKGAPPGSASVIRSPLSPANEQLISVSKEITGRKTKGAMKSVLVGPAFQWDKFLFEQPVGEISDKVKFLIYSVDTSGKETLLSGNSPSGFDLSNLKAKDFPYVRVVFEAEDEINLTPAVWKNWVVVYEPLPEGVLFYKGTLIPQSVQEGQPWSARFAFANISSNPFEDSLKVEMEVVTQETQHKQAKVFEINAPAPGDTTFFVVASTTLGKVGTNSVSVIVNNRIAPENNYNNNFATLPAYLLVQPDKTKPLLEVTIDGREIRNGDFVSANPLIQLKLKDENPFILKKDTVGVTILLSYPCDRPECAFKRIAFRSNSVKWFPATASSDFRVEFTPANLIDGDYVLSVQATDASGNLSGAQPYQVSFKVKSETVLDFTGVYPNPSAIGFTFNFELSGNVLPEEFSLEISSSTGQVACVFGTDDVRQFYIGTNELRWNGADPSGKMLSNGIYFYRLKITVGGKESIDTGRLIIMR